MKQYLKEGDRVFCTGCHLVYQGYPNSFVFDGWEDEVFYDGLPVETEFVNNKNGTFEKYFVEEEL